MPKTILPLIAVPFMLNVSIQSADAAPVLDVNNLITGSGQAGVFANGTTHASQSFTVGLTGYLSSIDLFAYIYGNTNGLFGLDIYRGGTANAPGNTFISSSYLPAASYYQREGVTSFVFAPTAIAVTAGEVLTFRMTATQGTTFINYTQMSDGRISNGYAGGYQYDTYGYGFANADLNFRTFIDSSPLPEPAGWAMILIGFGGMGSIMRRQRRVMPRVRFT